jgi:hypothetical protein
MHFGIHSKHRYRYEALWARFEDDLDPKVLCTYNHYLERTDAIILLVYNKKRDHQYLDN